MLEVVLIAPYKHRIPNVLMEFVDAKLAQLLGSQKLIVIRAMAMITETYGFAQLIGREGHVEIVDSVS